MPTEIDEVERRIMQLEIERQALSKETDEASRRSAATAIEAELADLREKSGGMKAQWQDEKDAIERRLRRSRRSSSRRTATPSAPSATPTCSAPPSSATARSRSSRRRSQQR